MATPTTIAISRAALNLSGEGVTQAVHWLLLGDSIMTMAGTGSAKAAAFDAGNLYTAPAGQTRAVCRWTTDSAYVGGLTGLAEFADDFFALTGLKSVFTPLARSTLTITAAAAPTRHLDFSAPTLGGGNFFFNTAEMGYSFESALDGAIAELAESPGVSVIERNLLWWGGATDAFALRAGTITQADIVTGYENLIAWFRANYGATDLYILGSGEIGTDAADADSLNISSRDMPGLRAAQLTAAGSANIVTGFVNDPVRLPSYNTITTDGAGRWLAGQERHDGSHGSQAFNVAALKRAAYNIAVHKAYVTPAAPTITGAASDLDTELAGLEVDVETVIDLRTLFAADYLLTFDVNVGTIDVDGYTWRWTPTLADYEIYGSGNTDVIVTATNGYGVTGTAEWLDGDINLTNEAPAYPSTGTLEYVVPPGVADTVAAAMVGDTNFSVADATTGGDATLTLLLAPDDGGAAITDYEYKIGAGSWVSAGLLASPLALTGLFTDGVATDVYLRAVNSVGNGPDGTPDSVTTTTAGAGLVLESHSFAFFSSADPGGPFTSGSVTVPAGGMIVLALALRRTLTSGATMGFDEVSFDGNAMAQMAFDETAGGTKPTCAVYRYTSPGGTTGTATVDISATIATEAAIGYYWVFSGQHATQDGAVVTGETIGGTSLDLAGSTTYNGSTVLYMGNCDFVTGNSSFTLSGATEDLSDQTSASSGNDLRATFGRETVATAGAFTATVTAATAVNILGTAVEVRAA